MRYPPVRGPAGDDKLAAFASGTGSPSPNASKKHGLSLNDIKEVGVHMRTKQVRRIAEKREHDDAVNGSTPSKPVRVIVEKQLSSDKLTLLRERITVLKEMKEMNIDVEETTTQLGKCLEQLNQHQASMTATTAMPAIVPASPPA
eukprot:gb/GECG01012845.1/.p1 GENE.gb/GECG01012845.1/~~gb/GECG01012845.1/.p1  ORF type:complete len:145 (+),score=21.38 gb/GECG01012845.1/:1-435(+)